MIMMTMMMMTMTITDMMMMTIDDGRKKFGSDVALEQ